MHPDIHLLAERYRAAERQTVTRTRRPSLRLSHQLGWALVEIGLRLVQTTRRPAAQTTQP